jgi:hypothetical protein
MPMVLLPSPSEIGGWDSHRHFALAVQCHFHQAQKKSPASANLINPASQPESGGGLSVRLPFK